MHLALLIGLASITSAAPEPAASAFTPTAALTTNLAAPVGGLVTSLVTGTVVVAATLEYEHVLRPPVSGYGFIDGAVTNLLGRPLEAAGLAAGLRWYFGDVPLVGLWVGPELGTNALLGLGAPIWTVIGSGYVGYNFRVFTRGVLSVGAGLGWRGGPLGSGFVPGIRANIGKLF